MLFFASSIAIGVGFLLAVSNLLLGIQGNIASKSRSLLAADVSIRSWRPFDQKTEETVNTLKQQGYRTTRLYQFVSMLRPQRKDGTPFLVSVRAIEPAFPFYGTLKLSPAGIKKTFFASKEKVCLVAKEAIQTHNLKLGEQVKLGHISLKIIGFIDEEPDQVLTARGIAPRVMIPRALAKQTGLIRFGSRIRHTYLIAAKAGFKNTAPVATALKKQLGQSLRDPYLQVLSYTDSQPNVREVIARIAIFLVFVSLVALLLGAIGMAASVTTFLNEQLRTVGIFRCVGFSPSDVTSIYNRLCLLMGILGGILGVIFGSVLSLVSGQVLNQLLQVGLEVSVHPLFVLESFFISCALTLGLNYATVRELARLSPQEILSGRLNRIQISRRALFTTVALFLIGFFLYALKTAYSLPVAGFFTITILGLLLACVLLIGLCLWVISLIGARIKGSNPLPFALRHGLRQLVRQRVRTMTFLLSLTIGVTLISSLNILQNSLITDIQFGDGRKIPSLFMVDVQTDQVKGINNILKPYKHDRADFNPLVRARLTAINGKDVTPKDLKGMTLEDRSRARLLSREQNLTYKEQLNKSETIIAGKFWAPGSAKPQVSVEMRFANRLGLSVGDTVTFDIQGRELKAEVTSIRSINWMSMLPNFFLVLPKKVLQHAPQVMITSVTLHDKKDIPSFQRQLNKAYPNISTIQIAGILKNVKEILGYFIKILKGLAWACVFIGLLLLAGTLSMAQAERRNKVALMRSLGCEQKTIVLIDCIEFLAIGVITAAIVVGLSWGMSAVITSMMDITLHYAWSHALEVFLVAIVLPLFVGLLTNRTTYKAGVMENLRNPS